MPEQVQHTTLAIVGAGPAGLSTAYHAMRAGIDHIVFERGCIADNIRRFPKQLVFYSTAERVELGDVPMILNTEKPTRTEAVRYYTRFAQVRGLDVHTYENVVLAEPTGDGFRLVTESHVGVRREYTADKLVLAFGAYDEPNHLGVPGEDLPHVSHFYDEPERYTNQRVLIVGGKGSASEAALQIFRAGGDVTISYRRERFSGLKYWIEPDLTNRIEEGSIGAYLPSWVREIKPGSVILELGDGSAKELPIDFVLALTGYSPKLDLFDQVGVAYDEQTARPTFDPDTFESNVPGCYIAGCIAAGNIGNEIFIENGRLHGEAIAKHLQVSGVEAASV